MDQKEITRIVRAGFHNAIRQKFVSAITQMISDNLNTILSLNFRDFSEAIREIVLMAEAQAYPGPDGFDPLYYLNHHKDRELSDWEVNRIGDVRDIIYQLKGAKSD